MEAVKIKREPENTATISYFLTPAYKIINCSSIPKNLFMNLLFLSSAVVI